jgi:hypothetical protein
VNGLLLKLRRDSTGAPGRWFWKLFQPIRPDLDRLYWCFTNQPWMGAPDKFQADDQATESFAGEGETSVMLWRPGSLGRYADHFAEEFIDLWGIDPTSDDPQQLAARFNAAAWRDMEAIVQDSAHVWLLYTDSTCWEIFAREPRLLAEVRAHLHGKPWVEVYESDALHRGRAFGTAGLSEVWRATTGDRA